MEFTAPDIVVLIVCAVLAIRGAFKGFAWQTVRLIGTVLAVAGASAWYAGVGAWLDETVSFIPSAVTAETAWFLIFVGIFLLATWFAWMAKGAVKRVNLGGADRLFGFGFGALTGLVLCTVGFLFWGSVVTDETLEENLKGSVTRPYMNRVVDTLEPLLPPDIHRTWSNVLHRLHQQDAIGG